jgi:hypothetical protein
VAAVCSNGVDLSAAMQMAALAITMGMVAMRIPSARRNSCECILAEASSALSRADSAKGTNAAGIATDALNLLSAANLVKLDAYKLSRWIKERESKRAR